MIVADTNVLSELLRPRPDPAVLRWADALPVGNVATTAVTVAELLHGVARMPRGRRRRDLALAIEALVGNLLAGRVYPFAADCAGGYAEIVSGRERLGRPISRLDAQIAAICMTNGCALATRNTRDFANTGVDILDPWGSTPPSP